MQLFPGYGQRKEGNQERNYWKDGLKKHIKEEEGPWFAFGHAIASGTFVIK